MSFDYLRHFWGQYASSYVYCSSLKKIVICEALDNGIFSYLNYNEEIFDDFADIESKLKRIEEDPEGSGTTHLFNCIQGVSSVANRAFEPLFERQVVRIRNLV